MLTASALVDTEALAHRLLRAYYEKVTPREYAALADLLSELSERGDLRLDDLALAAHQFTWLIPGVPMDRSMFFEPNEIMTDEELDHMADAGVMTFLTAYGSA